MKILYPRFADLLSEIKDQGDHRRSQLKHAFPGMTVQATRIELVATKGTGEVLSRREWPTKVKHQLKEFIDEAAAAGANVVWVEADFNIAGSPVAIRRGKALREDGWSIAVATKGV